MSCSAATLLGGLAFDKPLLGMVFDSVFHLTRGRLAQADLALGVFFFALAIFNEIVWRTQTTDFWVSFKLFGVVPLTFLFAALQVSAADEIQHRQEKLARRYGFRSHLEIDRGRALRQCRTYRPDGV